MPSCVYAVRYLQQQREAQLRRERRWTVGQHVWAGARLWQRDVTARQQQREKKLKVRLRGRSTSACQYHAPPFAVRRTLGCQCVTAT